MWHTHRCRQSNTEEIDFRPLRSCALVQDILEHRFAHIRAGMGTHKAPTSAQAFQASGRGDLCRMMHGKSRRNAGRSKGKKFATKINGQTAHISAPVNAEERVEVVRAATCNDSDHVYETRSLRCRKECVTCGVSAGGSVPS